MFIIKCSTKQPLRIFLIQKIIRFSKIIGSWSAKVQLLRRQQLWYEHEASCSSFFSEYQIHYIHYLRKKISINLIYTI